MPAGGCCAGKIEALGATVHVSKNTKEIVDGDTRSRNSLVFADGTSLETDLIVFSAGIRPRDELARAPGLAVGERGGIGIDSHCQTTNPDIYAIGECALWQGRIFGLVAPGYQMAEVAARHLAGETHVQFLGADMSTKLKLMGVDVATIGDAHGSTPGALNYVFTDEAPASTRSWSSRTTASSCSARSWSATPPTTARCCSWRSNRRAAAGAPGGSDPAGARRRAGKGIGVDLLPDVGAGLLLQQRTQGRRSAPPIAGGCTSLGALKKTTKAATSCGGCVPLAKQILDAELKKRGVAVNNHLCEHFAFSRQELFHLVRIGRAARPSTQS